MQLTLVSIHIFFPLVIPDFLLLLVSAFDSLRIQGTISVGVDATDLFDRYDEDFEEMPGGGFPHIEINKMHISQSIEVHIKASSAAEQRRHFPCQIQSCNRLPLRLL